MDARSDFFEVLVFRKCVNGASPIAIKNSTKYYSRLDLKPQ